MRASKRPRCSVCGEGFTPAHSRQVCCGEDCYIQRRRDQARKRHARNPHAQRTRARINARKYYAKHRERLQAVALARYHRLNAGKLRLGAPSRRGGAAA